MINALSMLVICNPKFGIVENGCETDVCECLL